MVDKSCRRRNPRFKKRGGFILKVDPLNQPKPFTCIASISRQYYPTLSLVSKNFRSLLASPELYQTRSLLRVAESCLYVCIYFPTKTETDPCWFTLCRKPKRTLAESSGYLLVPITSLQPNPAHSSSLQRSLNNLASSSV
ncbi:hypothetical protein CARUB_v10011996mg [Capsella rubella]|uniref:F-box domain-containing protein n=1 Tax=Capsella rubella TaxID=81985 RepID=R0GPE9_9BRAS|nr:hypothetical protein CARUB_v10011996mg [Capsella rubella]